MQLLTVGGQFQSVATRAEFVQGVYQGEQSAVQLVPRPSGELLSATYEQLYRRNAWVYACCNIISRGLCNLPLLTYQLLADPAGGRQRVRGDLPNTPGRYSDAQRLDRLMIRPRPLVSRGFMWRKTMRDLLLRGNGLWEKERDPCTGKIDSLRYWPWRAVTPVRQGAAGVYGGVFYGQQGPVLHYNVTEPNTLQTRALMPMDVVHFRAGDSEDGEMGVSPLEPIASEIAIQDAVNRQLKGWFAQGANPSVHVKVARRPTEDEQTFLQEQFRQLYGGPENAGKVIFSMGDVTPLNAASGFPQAVDVARVSREAVFGVYGVPPPLAGILDKSVHSTINDLRSWWLRDLIGPWTDMLEGELQSQLIDDPSEPNWSTQCLFVEWDFSKRLQPDLANLAVALQRMTTSGNWTPNEGRDYTNMPRDSHPDADKLWMPVNTAPIGSAPAGGGKKGLGTPGPESGESGAGA